MTDKTTVQNKLYFYTFPSAYNAERPMLKIGQTTQEDVQTRISQQMGTATPEKPELMGQFEVNFTDHDFHRFLLSRGIEKPDGAGTEWFFTTAEEATTLLDEFTQLHGGLATPIRKPLDVRPYQREFVNQFCATEGDFLLFAKCRSGKSVMGMLAATEADFRSVMVVSLRTSAANSWLADPETFTAFHEWDAIDLHDDDAIERIKQSQARGRRILMVGTVQGADDKYPLQAKIKRLFPNGIDALYLDECHIGGLSSMVTKLKSSIDFGRVLEISGTAFKAAWFYSKENTFTWDYTKEQAAGLGLPRMDLTLVKYDADELNGVYGDDPDRLNNIWTVEDGCWQDPQAVRNFFTKYFTHGRQTHKKRQLFRDSNHIVMSLPSVDACRLAVETMESLSLPWAPLSITGETGNDQAVILDHVSKHDSTICFTRWANVVGVTVPAWDTVVHAARTESAEFWVQFSFRGGSTRNDRWKVIDFASEQALHSIIEMVQATTEASETTEAGDALRKFLEFADIHEFDDGFTDVDYNGFLNLACSSPEDTIAELNRRASRAGSYGEYSDHLATLLVGATAIKNVEVVSTDVNSNGTNDRGNMKREGVTREATQNEMKLLLKQIKGALEAVPTVVYVHEAAGEPITTVFQLLASEYLLDLTGVNAEGFKTAIADGWIAERELSAITSHAALSFSAMSV